MTVIVIGNATKTSSAASEVLMRDIITVKPVLLLLLMMMIIVTTTKTDVRILTTKRRFRLKLIVFPAYLPKRVIAAERSRMRRRLRCRMLRRLRCRKRCRMRCRMRLSGCVGLFRQGTSVERVLPDEKSIAAIR